MATVTLNSQNVGTSWMTPYRLNVSDAIKEGENTFELNFFGEGYYRQPQLLIETEDMRRMSIDDS